jgi:hypothetical protein
MPLQPAFLLCRFCRCFHVLLSISCAGLHPVDHGAATGTYRRAGDIRQLINEPMQHLQPSFIHNDSSLVH